MERFFAQLLHDAPKLGILHVVREAEREQNLRLVISGGCSSLIVFTLLVLLVPLGYVENELIDNWVVVLMLLV